MLIYAFHAHESNIDIWDRATSFQWPPETPRHLPQPLSLPYLLVSSHTPARSITFFTKSPGTMFQACAIRVTQDCSPDVRQIPIASVLDRVSSSALPMPLSLLFDFSPAHTPSSHHLPSLYFTAKASSFCTSSRAVSEIGFRPGGILGECRMASEWVRHACAC
jgi:hypothetical protein